VASFLGEDAGAKMLGVSSSGIKLIRITPEASRSFETLKEEVGLESLNQVEIVGKNRGWLRLSSS